MRVPSSQELYDCLVSDILQLKRGVVWCIRCGACQTVDSATCLRHGWPMHCGATMTIDSPEEREALKRPTTSPADE